ncbi:hypothetical protein IV203_022642 [Nitzschia inconspicua]|uniref:Uncharacterized protein n=1 Tax=Nitzschia inconspicua TaxID=303405 RepID=A0A9K3KKA1_9STRA|nr:hypothetical protein IV203_022642 [Nitzschia inconspicua]
MDEESYRILQQVCSNNKNSPTVFDHGVEPTDEIRLLDIPPSLDWLPPRPRVFPNKCDFCCITSSTTTAATTTTSSTTTQQQGYLRNNNDATSSETIRSKVNKPDKEQQEEEELSVTSASTLADIIIHYDEVHAQEDKNDSLFASRLCCNPQRWVAAQQERGDDYARKIQPSMDALDRIPLDRISSSPGVYNESTEIITIVDGMIIQENQESCCSSSSDNAAAKTKSSSSRDTSTTTTPPLLRVMTQQPLRNASQLFLGVCQLLLSMLIADHAVQTLLHKTKNKKKNHNINFHTKK